MTESPGFLGEFFCKNPPVENGFFLNKKTRGGFFESGPTFFGTGTFVKNLIFKLQEKLVGGFNPFEK